MGLSLGPDLLLPEELMLLDVDPENKRLVNDSCSCDGGQSHHRRVGAARPRVDVPRDEQDTDGPRVSVLSADPLGIELEDRALELLAARNEARAVENQRPLRIDHAAYALALRMDSTAALLDSLATRGIVRWRQVQRLRFFKHKKVELLDPSAVERLLERLIQAIHAPVGHDGRAFGVVVANARHAIHDR